MTAPPPVTPADDAVPSESPRKTDARDTWLLLGGLFLLLFVLAVWTSFGTRDCGATECNETLLGIRFVVAPPGLWFIFGVSLIVSIARLYQRRVAFFVPLIGAAAMLGCVVLASILRDAAFNV